MQSVPRFAITTESNARLKISKTLRAKLAEKGIPESYEAMAILISILYRVDEGGGQN